MASEKLVIRIEVMRIVRKSQTEIWPVRGDYHVLTYAEEGFSPLDVYGRPMGVTKTEQVAFCARVNQHFETGSLFPSVAISVVPRALIRESQDVNALVCHIGDFLKANMQSIKARKVICDFRTPNVASFIIEAIEVAMQSPDASIIDEVVVIE
jgi:hypothetical protein